MAKTNRNRLKRKKKKKRRKGKWGRERGQGEMEPVDGTASVSWNNARRFMEGAGQGINKMDWTLNKYQSSCSICRLGTSSPRPCTHVHAVT